MSTAPLTVFTELQFQKLIFSTVEEIQIELVSVTTQKVPSVGTERVVSIWQVLTMKFTTLDKHF